MVDAASIFFGSMSGQQHVKEILPRSLQNSLRSANIWSDNLEEILIKLQQTYLRFHPLVLEPHGDQASGNQCRRR